MTAPAVESRPFARWITVTWWVVLYVVSALLAYNIWFVEPIVGTGEGFRATWLYRYGDPWLGWLLLPVVLAWRRWLAADRVQWPLLVAGHAVGAAAVVFLAISFRAGLLLISNHLPVTLLAEVWRDIFTWGSAALFAGLYAAVALPAHAFDYYSRWRDGQRESEELKLVNARMEARLMRARLDAMKMQLHPHYLFNALNSITALIRRNRSEEAEEAVAKLGALLRRALNHRQELLVPLGEELEFLEYYFAIERIRFRDRLQVEFEVPEECRPAAVPSLLLQPLVENAMKHGFSRQPEARLLRLRVWREGGELHLELYNDGPALTGTAAAGGTGIGLSNTRARLELMYGNRASLRLADAPPRGVSARIVLPFEIPSDHEKDQDADR